MRILNLTMHAASAPQVEEGVVEPADKGGVKSLLLFTSLPAREEVEARAAQLAELAAKTGADAAMIGGAPFLMGALESALKEKGVRPLFAFSERRSVEEVKEDGSTVKKAVFVHLGFVEG